MSGHKHVTPANPSRKSTARVKDALPVPTDCRHCKAAVRLVENEAIYGRHYGQWPWAYLCTNKACGAYVGLHPFTALPLGTLATKSIREARKQAKAVFNPLWESGLMTRSEAYAWLALQLGIPTGECHIGWFDEARCAAVVTAITSREAIPQ